jgi:hypothetical protein
VLAGVIRIDDLDGPGNLSVAMLQIQAASPKMVSCRTWSRVPDRVSVVVDKVKGLPLVLSPRRCRRARAAPAEPGRSSTVRWAGRPGK